MSFVKASYSFEMVFQVPEDIDLNDKTQVSDWCIKWGTLYIHFVDKNKKPYTIEPRYRNDDDIGKWADDEDFIPEGHPEHQDWKERFAEEDEEDEDEDDD
jgi:hypothetical protein